MTLEEKYMAGGQRLAQEPNVIEKFFKIDKNDEDSIGKILIDAATKSTKEVVSSAKEIFKILIGK